MKHNTRGYFGLPWRPLPREQIDVVVNPGGREVPANPQHRRGKLGG